MGAQELVPLVLLAPVLAAVGWSDLRRMRIPNVLSLVALGLFVLTLPLLPWPEAALRMQAAAVVFTLGFAAFAAGLCGGGDVKILAALMLFIPSQTWALYGLVFAVAMIAGIAFVLALRAAPWFRNADLVTVQAKGQFPMGISIALSGIAHPIFILTQSQAF